ncbi:hypothetical protein [Rufibacter sp. LB8]|nr:hypothetical protein [Rufibacter sp. LB8]
MAHFFSSRRRLITLGLILLSSFFIYQGGKRLGEFLGYMLSR